MARRLTSYRIKRTAPNGRMLRDNCNGYSIYYHTPPYRFLKKHGRYYLLFHAIAAGRLHVDTRRGIIYRRRSRNMPYRVAVLETDRQRGYHFIRLYARFQCVGPNGHVYYRYYRQAICVQIVVWLIANGQTDIPPDHEIDHKNCRVQDNRGCNLHLLTRLENQARKYEQAVRANSALATF